MFYKMFSLNKIKIKNKHEILKMMQYNKIQINKLKYYIITPLIKMFKYISIPNL